MSENPKFKYTISRSITERCNNTRLDGMITYIVDETLKDHSVKKNWSMTSVVNYTPQSALIKDKNGNDVHGYIYTTSLFFEKEHGSFQNDIVELDKKHLIGYLHEACHAPKFSTYPWVILDDNGVEVKPDISITQRADSDIGTLVDFERSIPWGELDQGEFAITDKLDELMHKNDDDMEAYFSDTIFDRGKQLRTIFAHIKRGIDSCGMSRNHVLLYGHPGGGKTLCLEKLKEVLPLGSYFSINADSATKAGLQKNFLQTLDAMPGGIPPIFLLEEIDKSVETVYNPLLSMLDTRGMIEKNTARMQKKVNAKILAIGTVNDLKKFESMLSGALASRFSKKMVVPLPPYDIIEKILMREVEETNGDRKWVKPAINLAKQLKVKDPRSIKAFLCGGDRLLDGSFQKDQLELHALEQQLENELSN